MSGYLSWCVMGHAGRHRGGEYLMRWERWSISGQYPKKSREQKRADKTRARAKKRHQRHAQRPSPPLGSPLGRFPFGDVPEAPPGFRPLPMTQAMLEFAAPLMDYVEQGTIQDPNA